MSGEGISTNPKKVEAVTKWPTPITVYDVRSFLGFVGRDLLRTLARLLNQSE